MAQRWQIKLTVALFPVVLLVSGLGAGCPQLQNLTPGNGSDNTPGNSGLTGKYVGADRCAQCHQNIHDNWAGTLHSKALDNLEAAGQGTNTDCLGCHTTGFGQDGGFVDRATTNGLAGVQCETCHGPGGDHAANVTDVSLRPKIDISASVCGQCHTGPNQPNYDQWQDSGHATVVPTVATSLVAGTSANTCGLCHSGDARYQAVILNQTISPDLLSGADPTKLNAQVCVICHDPHMQTGNAATPDPGRDYQLRYPEAKTSTASNTILGTQDTTRFNLCGQCHHDRGATWQSTSRGPHHSVQANVFLGEMAVPDGTPVLVPSVTSPHDLAPAQCATCHMYRVASVGGQTAAISGHEFTVNFNGCARSGCHPTADNAQALAGTLQATTQSRLDAIKAALGNVAKWEYSSSDYGGPANQAGVPSDIKKIRFLYHYVTEDQSLGVHNPDYLRSVLTTAEGLITSFEADNPGVLPYP